MGPQRPRTFGVEEEYLLLDAATGAPVNLAAVLMAETPELNSETDREFFSSQLETATPICHEGDEAQAVLEGFRSTVAKAAAQHRAVLAGTGLPPVGGDVVGTVTPKARYRLIEAEMRSAAQHQYATGTHVHVEVPSPEAGVDVLVRLARWAPALLALTANSPLWCGEPTGFASWRHIMGLSWPVSGYPLGFADEAEYRRSVSQLIGTGIVPDAGLLTWVARLSERYPTVELRIADAQLGAADAVAFATIVRALVDRALADCEVGTERPYYAPAVVNGANWRAARNGLAADLIDPLTAETLPAFDLVERMLSTIETELDRFGDRARVEQYVGCLRDTGDPGRRQLDAFEASGVNGLIDLYRREGSANAAGNASAAVPSGSRPW